MGTHIIYRKAVTADHEVTGATVETDGSGYYKMLTIVIYCGSDAIGYTNSFIPASTKLYGWVQTAQLIQL